MAIDKELLDILCCPATKVELAVLPKKRIDAVNQQMQIASQLQAFGS